MYVNGFEPPLLCVFILSISDRTYSLKSTSNDGFLLRNFPWQFYLLLQFSPAISWKEVAKEIFIQISFWCLIWDLNRGLSSNKPTNCLLHYGDLYGIKYRGKNKSIGEGARCSLLSDFCQKSTNILSPKKYFSIFRFVKDVWDGASTVASTHYLLD